MEFRRHFVEYIHVETLVALRVATKGWNTVADALIDEGVRSGELMVHDGKDIGPEDDETQQEWRTRAIRVIFFLDITKVGGWACYAASNLVVVDIPEGVESVGEHAFHGCLSLTTLSFPRTLTYIGDYAFYRSYSLDNVNLLHTNLQELKYMAFDGCSNLTSMTIPESLQTLGLSVFQHCKKLVPSNVNPNDTKAVVDYLRSNQTQS
ncbi:hypothetical protein TrLO_g7 [Triparma laevis f. longispina]|uniref:Uncharacterized protein n=1 Tax=Triparma laevis f. longispina TaxID=1714387 RepID=A0A9W7AFD2_9STRA|nr:hypothetical protein TrLO_g7 [Triparma laevis f. longispina]